MRHVITCDSIEEADMLVSHLKSCGIKAHKSGDALANMNIPLFPDRVSVYAPNPDAGKARAIIERDFPAYRQAGIQICMPCSEAMDDSAISFRRPSFLFGLWIRMQAAFRFKSLCPRCRRFY